MCDSLAFCECCVLCVRMLECEYICGIVVLRWYAIGNFIEMMTVCFCVCLRHKVLVRSERVLKTIHPFDFILLRCCVFFIFLLFWYFIILFSSTAVLRYPSSAITLFSPAILAVCYYSSPCIIFMV